MVRRLIPALFALAVIALFGQGAVDTTVAAQPGRAAWTQLMPTTAPSARGFAAMATNPGGGVVLFGGQLVTDDGYVALGDTWTFANGRWTEQRPPVSPPPRYRAAIAYDEVRGVVVLFGGDSLARELGDTWMWDGSAWSQHQPPVAPSPHFTISSPIAYDAARELSLLFFRSIDNRSTDGIAETWAWDGAAWTLLNPETSPPVRGRRHGLRCREPAGGAHRWLLPHRTGLRVHNDTWAWDGTTWTPRPSAGTPLLVSSINQFSTTLSYHPGLGAAVLVGADNENSGTPTQTWIWTGAVWAQLDPAESPIPRLGPATAYAAGADAIILFGGRVFREEHGGLVPPHHSAIPGPSPVPADHGVTPVAPCRPLPLPRPGHLGVSPKPRTAAAPPRSRHPLPS